jgi:hypothetical protein
MHGEKAALREGRRMRRRRRRRSRSRWSRRRMELAK